MPDVQELDLLLIQDPFNQITAELRNLRLGQRLHLSNGKIIQATTINFGAGQRKVFYVSGKGQPSGGRGLNAHNTHRTASEAAKVALARTDKKGK
jgi:hypothetical protein